MIKVLVVDDSALVRKLIGQAFSREADFEVGFARNGREALAAITDFRPDVVTLDVHMPEMDGLSCLDRIMIETPCPVVMVSLRLRDRVRFRIGEGARAPASSPGRRAKSVRKGEGLVLVGTSTGGPPALEALLSGLPPSFPWPILVAQHMPATFTGPLARRLDGMSALRVQEVRDPIVVQPGHVYIGRGDADVIVSRRGSALLAMAAPAQADYPWHPSTDRLVRTALNHMAASQLIGILMTGMGNDGAEAMALIHAGGGKTIAEAEETAVVWGMPGELVKAKGADFIMPLNKIAAQLKKLVS
ncbi:chemotaxis protein CheB [Bradyrhizobium sp. ma5]|uniref:chemotaxis protein CheB n=1 Tax=Bradyrhizobium sp. ma5 TaxID=3344828 RepID=UPI0035D3FEFD